MPAPTFHPRDPLHGITLATIVQHLADRHGWAEMARRIPVRCFMFDPTVTSSLKFLRKTPWAREKVENWFILNSRSDRQNRDLIHLCRVKTASQTGCEGGLLCAASVCSFG